MMSIERRNPKWATARRVGAGSGPGPTRRTLRTARGFTLLEVLLALIILAIIMVVVHSVFYSAIQLRNTVDQSIQKAIPLQQALSIIKRDVANLTLPGGTLTGTLQTTPTTESTTSATHEGEQCGPTFYTASGRPDEYSSWPEMRKVTYYLVPSGNNTPGLDLIRSVTRNLLPVMTEQYTDEKLLSGVKDLKFEFYDGTQWVDSWDSTTASDTGTSSLPTGIRVQLWLAANDRGAVAQTPVELVVPVVVNGSTNSTSSTSLNAGGGA